MQRIILMGLIIPFILCACVASSKPIDYREVQVVKPANSLELGDNQNSIDVTKSEQIKPIKYPRFDMFYDK
jgi:hypothetical protein